MAIHTIPVCAFHYSGKLGSKRKTKLPTITGTNPSLDQLLTSRLLISEINRTVSLFVSKQSPWQSMQFFFHSLAHGPSLSQANMRACMSKHQNWLFVFTFISVWTVCTWAFKHLPSLESDLPHPLCLTDRGESLRYQTGYWKKHILE